MIDLTESQKRLAKKRLETERERIRGRIASEAEIFPVGDGSPTESHYGSHAADEASDTYEEEQALGMRAHFEAELSEVEDALRRIETGAYGRCEECGQAIPAERLEVLSYARLCVGCQSKVDKAEARRQ